jgi:hypothetical protein
MEVVEDGRNEGEDRIERRRGAENQAEELKNILGKGSLEEIKVELENFLRRQEEQQRAEGMRMRMGMGAEVEVEGEQEDTLEEPIVKLLARSKSYRICRARLFCPIPGCTRNIRTKDRLSTHLKREHNVPDEEVQDIVRYLIGGMTTRLPKVCFSKTDGTRVERQWDMVRCHYLRCGSLHAEHGRIDAHIRQRHEDLRKDVEGLGEFWGTMRRIVLLNPGATIAEVLGEGQIYQCAVGRCWKVYTSERLVKLHFAQCHGEQLRQEWIAPRCELMQRYELVDEGGEEAEAEAEGEGEAGVRQEAREGAGARAGAAGVAKAEALGEAREEGAGAGTGGGRRG